MVPFVSLGLCGLSSAANSLRDRLIVAPERSARLGSTDLCGVAQAMGRHTGRAEFAQVGSRAFVETVVSCALTHRVEVFKCSVN